jgi:hypothetical protein
LKLEEIFPLTEYHLLTALLVVMDLNMSLTPPLCREFDPELQ